MKKPFLKIWQYSRETPVLESSFRPATLLKRDSNTVFPVNIGKFLRTPILKNICERLLLYKTFHDGKVLSPYKVTYQKNVFFFICLNNHVQHHQEFLCFHKSTYGVARNTRTASPSLAASLEPSVHGRNVASLSCFFRCCLSRYSTEIAELVSLSYSREKVARYSNT